MYLRAKLSIFVVTYNQEQYIRQALDSILMQQVDFAYEVIVGEDCSTDGTGAICDEYAAKYPFFHIYHHKTNLGLVKNWEFVLNHCTGKYVAMLEGDDYWIDAHKLQKQVDYLEAHKNVGLCYTDCDIYYEENKKWERAIYASARESFNAKTVKEPMTVWYKANNTWLYRKSVSDNIKPNKSYIDGALYFLYNMCLLADVEYIDRVTAVYRRHIGSASCFSQKEALRMYQYDRNCFLLEDKFIPLFPNSVINIKSLYNSALFNLYERAILYNDKDIVEKIENYFSNNIDIKMFREYTLSMRQEVVKVRRSKAYRIGKLLLKPFSIIKQQLSK